MSSLDTCQMNLISMVIKHDFTPLITARLRQSGDEATKQDLEHRANSFTTKDWWSNKEPSLTEMANSNAASDKKRDLTNLYNPYEGKFCGRQLSETVQEFLERLPPATSQVSDTLRWIFIANPYHTVSVQTQENLSQVKLADEAPQEVGSDWAKFVVLGGNLLEELIGLRHEIEKRRTGQAKGTITKAVNLQKETIVKKILDTAVQFRCTTGKVQPCCQCEVIEG